MKTPIGKVKVVGYEAPFVEEGEERGARRLTPWFFWEHSEAEELNYLLPPFRITMTDVVDGYFVDRHTIESLVKKKDGILLTVGFAGKEGHTLWMNGEGQVDYRPRNDVTVALRNYALGEVAKALSEIKSKEYEKACGCVGRALSADGSIPEALIAKGVVERLLKNERAYKWTIELATKRFPTIDVSSSVEKTLGADSARVVVNLRGPIASAAIIGDKKNWLERWLFRANPEGVVEEILNGEGEVARHVVKIANAITDSAKVKAHFRRLGGAVAARDGEAGVTGGDALLCIRREGEKAVVGENTEPRLYFAWMLQGMVAWYAEHRWGRIDGIVDDLVNESDALGDAALNVANRFIGKGWSLALGWSPWVEARLLASLGAGLLRRRGLGKVYHTEYPLKWAVNMVNGNGEAADVAFVNEWMVAGKEPEEEEKGMPGIFRFSGYYVFARRDYISRAKANGTDDPVKQAAEGGLQYLTGTDFERVVREIERRGAANGKRMSKELMNRVAWDTEFEHFIQGKRNVFLGGAHHAALLRKWWACGEEPPVERLLGPVEIRRLLGEAENRIIFADWLRKGDENKEVRMELATFCAEIWKTLCTILTVENGKREVRDKLAGPLLRCIYEGAVGRGVGGEERPWSFLTDWEQLQWICKYDSPAVVGRAEGRGVVQARDRGSGEEDGKKSPAVERLRRGKSSLRQVG